MAQDRGEIAPSAFERVVQSVALLGGVLLILATVLKMDYWRLVRTVLPFLVAELILLAVLILCPEVTLALPRLLGLIN